MRESRSPPPFNEEPQISKDFWGFFVFLPRWVSSTPGAFASDIFFIVFLHRDFSSSDFTDESEGNLAYRITHGFPRIFGRWPMARARNGLLFFCHADFADDADFFSLIIFSPTDFTDLHRFFSLIIFLMDLHGFSLVLFFFLSFLLFFCYFFISHILDLSVWDIFRRLFSQIIFIQILWKISFVYFFLLFVFCL